MCFAPLPSRSLMVSRKTTLPSPRVIRPLKSTIVMPSTCRVLAFMLTLEASWRPRSLLWQPLDQSDFSARFDFTEPNLVHECPHQEYSTARLLQKIFRGQRIGHFLGYETAALVADGHDHLAPILLEGQVHALLGSVGVAVQDGIDHRLANRHCYPAARVFIEAGLRGHLVGHLFGLVHAIQRGLHAIRNALWRGHQGLPISPEIYLIPVANNAIGKNEEVCLFAASLSMQANSVAAPERRKRREP